MNHDDLIEITGDLKLTLPRFLKTPTSDFEDPSVLSPGEIRVLRKMIAHGIHEILSFCLPSSDSIPSFINEVSLAAAMKKLIAVTWLVHPKLLVGENGIMNLTDLAAVLGCSRCSLSLKGKAFTDKWKFRGRLQKRLGSKENYSVSAKTGWDKRRVREAQEAELTPQEAASDA